MDSNAPRIAILMMEGTNNETESFRSFQESGAQPELVHIRDLELKKVDLNDYQGVFIPGGFSAGDYVRAGVIFAIRLKASAGKLLLNLAERGVPILGHCNGFQVLTELNLISMEKDKRDTILDVNESGRFECRTIYVKYTGKNKVLNSLKDVKIPMEIPIAHREGRLRFSNPDSVSLLKSSGRVLFTYTNPSGELDEYPWNPNGSAGSIAGISGEMENVFGMMPHPERIYYPYQLSNLQRVKGVQPIGKIFYDLIVDYARKN